MSGKMSDDYSSYEGVLEFEKDACGRNISILICMSEKYDYKVTMNGKEVKVTSPYPGLLQVSLPTSARPATIKVVKI
jgi:hypothetical protein